MSGVYDKLGIRFQFPTNWHLDEAEAFAGYHSVSVYSPGGSFWSVTVHPTQQSPQRLVDAALKTMEQEYDELDAEAVSESWAGHACVGYDLNFYCFDLTNTAVVRALATEDSAFLILYQADDREFTETEPVFKAISASLLASLSPPLDVPKRR